jgi:hypothetical protein
MARFKFCAGTTVAFGRIFGRVLCDVLPWVTPTRVPGFSTSEIAVIGDEVSQLERNQRLAEVDVDGARRRCVADGEIDISRLHSLEHVCNSLIAYLLEGDVEPFRQLLAQIDAQAVDFSCLIVSDHGQGTSKVSADPQLALWGQYFARVLGQCTS